MEKNILMVFAYPNHQSLNYQILTETKNGFEAQGHHVKIVDLYQENFNPVLYFDKEHRRRDMQFVEETKKYRDEILWADHLVFIYPIWWGGMPAILKGYFDRVFVTGFCYNFKGLLPEGKLKDKSATIITTDDTPAAFRFFALQDYGNVLKNQILRIMTGVKVKKHFRFSYVKGRKAKKIQSWLKECYDYSSQVSL